MTGSGFRKPMLATLVDEVVEGEDWLFERKLDGIRLIVARDDDRIRLYSRNGLDRTSTYPEIVEAMAGQALDRFIVDGEVVAFDGAVTSFSTLQARSGRESPGRSLIQSVPVVYYVFDLLGLDGHDCRGLPLRQRKQVLKEALEFEDPIRFSEHRAGGGGEFLKEACSKGWEGLIAKRADSTYRAGRSRSWLKLKCVNQQELVIGGYTDPKGSRSGFGALLLGHHSDGDLVYAGRVGTGFDDKTLDELGHKLRAIEVDSPPFVDPPAERGLHWTKPELVCEVGFTEWTSAGRLRHPRYLGLRHDKDPADVVREVPG